MRAKQGGSFATLLLLIPLSAIPLMAMFGVPKFAQLSASSEEIIPDIVRQSVGADVSSHVAESTHGFRSRAADLLTATPPPESSATAESNAPRWSGETSSSASTAAVADRVSDEPVTVQERRPSPRPMQTAAVESVATPCDEHSSTPAATPTASGLSWREASRRLEEVGITDFRLERGQSADRFLFFCRFSPGSDARIIQRFEAEAAEPLAAVEDVLAQVDAWLQHRYAQSRSWVQ